jgi:hypothetical protein
MAATGILYDHADASGAAKIRQNGQAFGVNAENQVPTGSIEWLRWVEPARANAGPGPEVEA